MLHYYCIIAALLLHYCCIIITLLLHYYFIIVVLLLLHYYYIIVALLLHYCCIIITILLHYYYNIDVLLLLLLLHYCCIIITILLYYYYYYYNIVALLLHYRCIIITLLTIFTDAGPINFIDEAMPRIGHLPEGVSVVYDVKSHVHALQFLPEMEEIKFPTTAIFKSCQYLPEEFSVFFILKHGHSYLKKECVFSVSSQHRTYVSVCLTSKKIIFTYNNKKSKFRNAILTDNKWHTVGFSVTGSHVTMTTDCLHRRKHKLRRNFPSFLEIQNSVIRIAKCESCNSAFQVMTFIMYLCSYNAKSQDGG